MGTAMTSRDRVAALLRREIPDRMGLFDHFWPETIRDYWSKQGYPKDTPPEEYFDYDIRFTGGGIDFMPMRGFSEVVEENDEWQLLRRGNGSVTRWWKKKSGTPEHVAFDCATPEIWASKYKPLLLSLDPQRVNDIPGATKTLAKARSAGKFTCWGGMFVFEFLRSGLGDQIMMESLALEPAWIHDFCRTYTDFYVTHLDYLFGQTGQPDGAFIYDDLGYSKGLFCSPAMLRELILPYYKTLFAYFHERGMPVIFHTCGGVTEAVPLLIEAGVDCLQPMEVKAGVDVLSLAGRFRNKLAFMGNLDVRVLERGREDEIEAEVAGKMEALKKMKAAYFFHTDHSVSPNVTAESYTYAIEVYRAHCRY